jgi:hypothetical protein
MEKEETQKNKMHRKYPGQQCQDETLNNDFRALHRYLVNVVIQFCKKNNLVIDELKLNADNLEESIKSATWEPGTDSCLVFEKYTQEYKDALNNTSGDKSYQETWNKILLEQEPYLMSI